MDSVNPNLDFNKSLKDWVDKDLPDNFFIGLRLSNVTLNLYCGESLDDFLDDLLGVFLDDLLGVFLDDLLMSLTF
jgi:hypothetical protein